MLMWGLRDTTVDVDIRLDPEPAGIFAAIAKAKESLAANIELASPLDFVPTLPGWRGRSEAILTAGGLRVCLMDPYCQALSKLERGLARDLADVEALRRAGKVDLLLLREMMTDPALSWERFPAADQQGTLARLDAELGRGVP